MLDQIVQPDLLKRLFRYFIATFISFCFTFGLPVGLVELGGVDPDHAALVGYISAFIVNFVVMRNFVYQSADKVRSQVWRYCLTALGMRTLEYLAFLLLHNVFAIPYYIALFSVLLCAFVLKFVIYRVLVFKPV